MDDALCDAYDEQEQLGGFATIIEDNCVLPCAATIVGVLVTIVGMDATDTRVRAICKRAGDRTKYRIDIRDLTIDPKLPMSECVDAYRTWSGEEEPRER